VDITRLGARGWIRYLRTICENVSIAGADAAIRFDSEPTCIIARHR
jgi:hypothetical protein